MLVGWINMFVTQTSMFFAPRNSVTGQCARKKIEFSWKFLYHFGDEKLAAHRKPSWPWLLWYYAVLAGAPVPGDDDAVRHGSFVARRQTFQVAVLSTISRLWVLPQQRFFVPVEFLKDPQAWWKMMEMAQERHSKRAGAELSAVVLDHESPDANIWTPRSRP